MNTAEELKDSMKGHLTAEVAADVWDEAPRLMLVVRDNLDRIRFRTMSTPEAWARGEVYAVIHGYAQASAMAFGEGFPPPSDEVLVGVAFQGEGWAAAAKTDEERDEIMAWTASGRRISEHPLGREMKMLMAMTTDGSMIFLSAFRGGDEVDEGGAGDGRIPDALAHLIDSLKPWSEAA